MHIQVDLEGKRLTYRKGDTLVFDFAILSGCEGSATPVGEYKAGNWVKDKTNAQHGPTAWSKDPWGNPYGPYFLPIHTKAGKYTTYGIHGTRGPGWSPFLAPPVPQGLLGFFTSDDSAKFLYCSHGCIRVANPDIQKLFAATMGPDTKKMTISITRGTKD